MSSTVMTRAWRIFRETVDLDDLLAGIGLLAFSAIGGLFAVAMAAPLPV